MPEQRTLLSFQEHQKQFAAYLRAPETNTYPTGLEERRVNIYKDLFFNNISSLLCSNFPVIHSILSNKEWSNLVRDFYASHTCHTPLFTEIGSEFVHYLQSQASSLTQYPIFLAELAHYEWAELALSIADIDLQDIPYNPQGDLLQQQPIASPLAWTFAYNFPVHHIRPDFMPNQASTTPHFLILVRDQQDQVSFLEANILSIQLLECLRSEIHTSGLACLEHMMHNQPPEQHKQLMQAGAHALQQFLKQAVILGTRCTHNE